LDEKYEMMEDTGMMNGMKFEKVKAFFRPSRLTITLFVIFAAWVAGYYYFSLHYPTCSDSGICLQLSEPIALQFILTLVFITVGFYLSLPGQIIGFFIGFFLRSSEVWNFTFILVSGASMYVLACVISRAYEKVSAWRKKR